MKYRIIETMEAVEDVIHLAAYMKFDLCNPQVSENFLSSYDKAVQTLQVFPSGYRGIGFEYRGYEIRLMPFGTYNLFFIVHDVEDEIVILRLLKDRRDWKIILQKENEYHF